MLAQPTAPLVTARSVPLTRRGTSFTSCTPTGAIRFAWYATASTGQRDASRQRSPLRAIEPGPGLTGHSGQDAVHCRLGLVVKGPDGRLSRPPTGPGWAASSAGSAGWGVPRRRGCQELGLVGGS